MYFSPKNAEKWGTGPKKGGSIDPLDPPILTGLGSQQFTSAVDELCTVNI